MIRYAVIGSGSDANAYCFSFSGRSILIDNGFSLKELSRRAELLGIDLSRVEALFISHMHGDHVRGAGPFARRYRIPVYLHRGLDFNQHQRRSAITVMPVEPGERVEAAGFSVRSFETYHDAQFPINFMVSAGGRNFLIITDTGRICPRMEELITETDVLFLEANYDSDMLASGPYPYPLKQRISSGSGHLSNDGALAVLNDRKLTARVQQIYLCHLSAVNNSPGRLQRLLDERLTCSLPVTICARGAMEQGKIASVT